MNRARGRVWEEVTIPVQLPVFHHIFFDADCGGFGEATPTNESYQLEARHTTTKSVGGKFLTGNNPQNPNSEVTPAGVDLALNSGLLLSDIGFDLISSSRSPRACFTAQTIIKTMAQSYPNSFFVEQHFSVEREFGKLDGLKTSAVPPLVLAELDSIPNGRTHMEYGFESLKSFYMRAASCLYLAREVLLLGEEFRETVRHLHISHGGLVSAMDIIIRDALLNSKHPEASKYQNRLESVKLSNLPKTHIKHKDSRGRERAVLKLSPCDGIVLTKGLLDVVLANPEYKFLGFIEPSKVHAKLTSRSKAIILTNLLMPNEIKSHFVRSLRQLTFSSKAHRTLERLALFAPAFS